MAYPTWPSELPARSLRDGFSRTFADSRLRSDMSTGPAKLRRRTSLAPHPVSLIYYMTWTQLTRLERFWNDETYGGSLPFWFEDHVYDGVPLLTDGGEQMLTDEGVPILASAISLVRFSSAPTHDPIGVRWRVSVSIDVMP